jgi:hypothetical protein
MEIRTHWLSLAFAVLRFYREERQHEEFTLWFDRLQKVSSHFPDHSARLVYEKCLWALGEMDDLSVRLSLAQWPAVTGDLVWQVRKASVLAEIGETREATTLTEATLAQIRRGSRLAAEYIPSLSREGWSMLLLYGLHNEEWVSGSWKRPDYRDRWRQLSSYGCDPWTELELLETKLEQPTPSPVSAVLESAAFQPGSYTSSHSFGDGLGERLIPAYQYLRLSEEAPSPPRIGNLSLRAKTQSMIADWFIRYDPERVPEIVCRLMYPKLIDRYFARHRVAAFRCKEIEHFHEVGLRAVEWSRQKIARIADPDNRCAGSA